MNPRSRAYVRAARVGSAVLAIVGISLMAAMAPSREAASGPLTSPPPTWERRVPVASGEAHRGPWRMNESDFRWVDDPSVDVWNSGEIAVAWVDQSRKEIFFQRYGRDGGRKFAMPTDVSKTPQTFSWLPRVVVAPDDPDLVYALWQEIVFSGGSHGGEIFFASSSDGGRTFSQPVNLSQSAAGDGKGRLDSSIWDNGSLDLARGRSGELYVAWTEYEGTLWFRRSTDGGRQFSAPLRINAEGDEPARGPSVAARGDAVHVAWAVGENASADIRFASSTDGGRSFGAARAVCESDGHSDAPKVAVDPTGTVHLVYAESPDGRGRPYQIRYSRMRGGATRFEAPKALHGSRGSHIASAQYPQISIDGEGWIYVLWEGYSKSQPRPQALALTYSRDGGDHFAPPFVVPEIADPALGFNGSQQGLLMKKLAVNRTGTLAIVNATFQSEKASHVWLLRGRVRRDLSPAR